MQTLMIPGSACSSPPHGGDVILAAKNFGYRRGLDREILSTVSRSFDQVFRFSSTRKACKFFLGRPWARDLSDVKVSGLYDAWRPRKRRKTKVEKCEKRANFDGPFTPQGWLRLAWKFGKTRFRRFPKIDFLTQKQKNWGQFVWSTFFLTRLTGKRGLGQPNSGETLV